MSDMTEASARAAAWPKAIFAITLFTENLEQTKEFYQRVFGLPVDFEDPNSAVFKFGGTLVNLLRITEANALIEPARVSDAESGSRFVFTIMVEDVDAMCAELVGRGVELLNGPMDRPWGIRTASFKDPAGCIWEIAK
jgi:catechol 2,3-dioxygenase-like lactoylglutathione lyase family enzyme